MEPKIQTKKESKIINNILENTTPLSVKLLKSLDVSGKLIIPPIKKKVIQKAVLKIDSVILKDYK